jgi:hypothetical protein
MPQQQQEFTNIRPIPTPSSGEFTNVRSIQEPIQAPPSPYPDMEIKKKYGLPQWYDLSKPPMAPENREILNPKRKFDLDALNAAYAEFKSPPKQEGFWANAWQEGKNIAGSLIDPGGATPSQNPLGFGLELAGRVRENPLNLMPIVGPMAIARGEQFKEDPMGAFGAGTTDALALTAPFLAKPVLNAVRTIKNLPKNEIAATRLMGSVLNVKKGDFLRGEDPRVSVVREGIAGVRKGSFSQVTSGPRAGAYEPVGGIAKKIQNSIDSYTVPLKDVLDQATANGTKITDVHALIDNTTDSAISNIRRTSGNTGAIDSLNKMRDALKQRGNDISPNELVEMRNDLRNQNRLFEGAADPAEVSMKAVREDLYHGFNEKLEGTLPNIRDANRRVGGLITALDRMFEDWGSRQSKTIGGKIDLKSPVTWVPFKTPMTSGLSLLMGTVDRPPLPAIPPAVTGAIGPNRLALPPGQINATAPQRPIAGLLPGGFNVTSPTARTAAFSRGQYPIELPQRMVDVPEPPSVSRQLSTGNEPLRLEPSGSTFRKGPADIGPDAPLEARLDQMLGLNRPPNPANVRVIKGQIEVWTGKKWKAVAEMK